MIKQFTSKYSSRHVLKSKTVSYDHLLLHVMRELTTISQEYVAFVSKPSGVKKNRNKIPSWIISFFDGYNLGPFTVEYVLSSPTAPTPDILHLGKSKLTVL